jgi:hypothetical protein
VNVKVTNIPTKDAAEAIKETLSTESTSSAVLRQYKTEAAVTEATSIAITPGKKPNWFNTPMKLGLSIGGAIIGCVIIGCITAYCLTGSALIACRPRRWCSSTSDKTTASRRCISSELTITDIDKVIADLGDIVEVSQLGVHFSSLWQELGGVCWDGLGDITKDIPYIRIVYGLCNQVVKMFEAAAENKDICDNVVELARQMQVNQYRKHCSVVLHKQDCCCDLKMCQRT